MSESVQLIQLEALALSLHICGCLTFHT